MATSCSIGYRCSSDLVLPWLWCRPVAAVLIQLLAWKFPYATGTVIKRNKKGFKKRKKDKVFSFQPFNSFFFFFPAIPTVAFGSSQARDENHAIATTQHSSDNNQICNLLSHKGTPQHFNSKNDMCFIFSQLRNIFFPLLKRFLI